MPLTLDPEILKAFTRLLEAAPELATAEPTARGDVDGLVAVVAAAGGLELSRVEPHPDVRVEDVSIPAGQDGVSIPARWYRSAAEEDGPAAAGPAVVYAHGGGLVGGSVDSYDPALRQYVAWTGVPMLSVDYRLAPGVQPEDPARDCFAALSWVLENAAGLGVDPARVAVMGDSAGGGVAAGAALLARDAGVPLARQILVYPMLDDRTTTAPEGAEEFSTWTYDQNYTGWFALLGEDIGSAGVSPYAAPARTTDFRGLAPAYVEVGTLDIFRTESVRYVQSLLDAGVDAELHVLDGLPHGYDWVGVDTPVADRWVPARTRTLRAL